MKRLDVELSRAIAELMLPGPRRGDCWGNALRAVPVVADLVGVPIYVEGSFGIRGVRTVAHAWLEVEDRVVDVSHNWDLADRADPWTVVRYLDLIRYSALRRFTVPEVLANLRSEGATLPILSEELEELAEGLGG